MGKSGDPAQAQCSKGCQCFFGQFGCVPIIMATATAGGLPVGEGDIAPNKPWADRISGFAHGLFVGAVGCSHGPFFVTLGTGRIKG